MQDSLFEESMDICFSPLTRVQDAIWISQNLFPKSALFNIGGYAVIHGSIDQKILEKSIHVLLEKHNALRIKITEQTTENRLQFKKNNFSPIKFIDFSYEESPEIKCKEWIENNFEISAGLEDDFFTTALLQISDDKYYWYVKVHHLVADGFSLSLIFNQVSEIYNQISENKYIDTATQYDFRNHIQEELSYLNSLKYENDEQFWLDKFRDNPEGVLFEKKSEYKDSHFSKRKEIVIPRELYNKIKISAKNNGISDFHYFLSLFYVLIQKLFQQNEFVIGIPLLNRNSRISKNTIGAFLNILPAMSVRL